MAEKKTEKYKLKEVCIRLAKGRALYSEQPLSSPAAALDVMKREMSQYDREVLCVVNMNSRLQPINFNIVSVGDINTSIAAIPNILKSGLMTNAGSFLLLHNHPSGDVTPSQDDILTTRKVIEAGKIMGIPCVDHIVIGGGNGNYCSMREAQLADFSSQIISMTAEDILRVADGTSLYEQGGENMPENARDNVQVPDFVLEAEAQMAKEAKEGKTAEVPGKREEVTIKFGKGLWAKIPADGTTVVTKPVLKGQDEQGKNIWENQQTRVPNQELKSMVEAYKTRAPQARDQRAAEPRESAREKLDALVKDTASKLTPEKTPKTKSKTKKGPEL